MSFQHSVLNVNSTSREKALVSYQYLVIGHQTLLQTERPAPAQQRDKGRSPAANIITRRAGGGGSRMIDTFTASLGRKARPKSATISPSRPATSAAGNRRSAALSRSPSRSKDAASSRSSMSLPRHSAQLNLRRTRGEEQEKNKRNSGAWSKPPTPGPLSPNTSDSEASNYSYRPGLPKSSML